MRRLRFGVLFLTALMLALPAPRVLAQADDYPNHPVNFIVPFAAGGVTSLFAHTLAQGLEKQLGKPFVVENRAGGGGLPAVSAVAHGPSDGYTILMASSTALAINVGVRKNLPYDPRKDLQVVSLIARVPFVLVVNPDLPVRSVKDLVDLIKSKPGKINFGTPGPGTFHHLNAELFKSIFGLNIVHVPYKGSVPALTDLVAGHIQMMFCDLPPALGLIRAGKLRALGVTTAQRVESAPELPPLAQVGIPGYDTASWHSVATQGQVPKPIVDKLHNALGKVMNDPEVHNLLVHNGTIPQVSPSPEELKKFVVSEIDRWGAVVEKAGLKGSR
jgi:tripartite-type tricarboxylate transporter receptor subunit TctC